MHEVWRDSCTTNPRSLMNSSSQIYPQWVAGTCLLVCDLDSLIPFHVSVFPKSLSNTLLQCWAWPELWTGVSEMRYDSKADEGAGHSPSDHL